MSDRDGILLEAPSRASSWTIGAAFLAGPIMILCGVPAVPALLAAATLGLFQTRPTKLLFRADALHIRWLFLRTRIAHADLASFLLDDRGVLLSMRDGSRHRIHVRGTERDAQTIREAIAHVLSQAAGVHPDGGPILRVGDQDVTPVALAEPSAALVASLDLAKRLAAERGADAAEPVDFVEALLLGPERAILATFGLPAPSPEPSASAYRGQLVAGLSGSLEASLRAARLASGGRKSELDPIGLLLELIRTGDPAAERLVAHGLVPMRILDQRAHGLSPAASDARSKKTLGDLLAGTDAPRVALVFASDDYTPYGVLARLLEEQLDFGPAEANAFARRVHEEGRVTHGSYPRDEGATLAIELMYRARRLGSPLLVELVADRVERR